MQRYILLLFPFLVLAHWSFAQDTFSIVAVDPNTGEIGSAGASCLDNIGFPGSNGAIIISDILPGRGAIHTQSYWTATNQANARLKMQEGLAPAEIITWLKQNDVEGIFGQLKRQYGIVDFDSTGMPRSAAFTGTSCLNWKGHRTGLNYAIQGNILLGPQILDSMEAHFLQTEGQPLAMRLMYALQGANVVGADSRCTTNGTSSLSAFVRVALPTDTIGGFYLDLNVPSLPAGQEPIDSLQTLFDAWAVTATQEASGGSIQCFPNPSKNGSFSLFWPYSEGAELKIYGTNGNQLRHIQVEGGLNTFESELPAGAYFIKVLGDSGNIIRTGKIVVR